MAEYPQFGIDLAIVCESCGRIVVFDAGKAALFYFRKRLKTALPLDTSMFVCKCGSKNVRSAGVPIESRPDPLPPAPPRLDPLYVHSEGRARRRARG
ncbi:hypothetical protein HZY97_20120 [Sphingomonas sp. R-74633]|uniref:hypothetical protein n=1 Tax=Sphingomonas sp. R-74633 TaxID=2751188 RepID=UPI0015D34020|nr:hypothetical protein [Sphingomonas sp. R-74633]NYT43092.1 hypothetical protein [Sphingomonas sp. R-74633]